MGSLQRGQPGREGPALHGQEIADLPGEDADGCVPGAEHGVAGRRLRFHDEVQLPR